MVNGHPFKHPGYYRPYVKPVERSWYQQSRVGVRSMEEVGGCRRGAKDSTTTSPGWDEPHHPGLHVTPGIDFVFFCFIAVCSPPREGRTVLRVHRHAKLSAVHVRSRRT